MNHSKISDSYFLETPFPEVCIDGLSHIRGHASHVISVAIHASLTIYRASLVGWPPNWWALLHGNGPGWPPNWWALLKGNGPGWPPNWWPLLHGNGPCLDTEATSRGEPICPYCGGSAWPGSIARQMHYNALSLPLGTPVNIRITIASVHAARRGGFSEDIAILQSHIPVVILILN